MPQPSRDYALLWLQDGGRSFAKGTVYAQSTTCGPIWAGTWEIVEELEGRGITLSILQFEAHTDDDQLAPLPLRVGNQCAGHHAGLAVAELPTSEVA